MPIKNQKLLNFILIPFLIPFLVFSLNHCSKKKNNPKKTYQKKIPLVQILPIQSSQISEKLNLVGKLKPFSSVLIYPNVGISGIVMNKKIDVGSQVFEGMQLLQINREIVTGNSFRPSSVTSKISGTISHSFVENGDMVYPTTKLFRIIQSSRLKIQFSIPEKDISKIQVGQSVQISFPSYPDKILNAPISKILPEIHNQNLSLQAEVILPNSNQLLKPQMFAQLQIFLKQKKGILIPLSSIILDDNIRYVYTYNSDEQTVTRNNIRTGNIYGENIQVLSGIKIGQKLVTQGHYQISDQETVKIFDPNQKNQKNLN